MNKKLEELIEKSKERSFTWLNFERFIREAYNLGKEEGSKCNCYKEYICMSHQIPPLPEKLNLGDGKAI